MIGRTLHGVLALGAHLQSLVKTRAFAHQMSLAKGARVLSTGRVVNIAADRSRIMVGAGSRIAGELLIFRHGGSIRIGEWCYVGEHSRIWSAAGVRIGDRVLISHNVNVHDCNAHSLNASLRHEQYREIVTYGHPAQPPDIAAADVVIEDDVWIGFNATVLKGCRIGARSIIAAGSIVTTDVPPDTLYAGGAIKRKLDASPE